jgi:hypothetical protein
MEDSLTVDLSEEVEKKSFSLDIDNLLFIPPTTSEDKSLDEEIITNLLNLIVKSKISNNKDPTTLFSTEKEITYDPSKDCLIPKVKVGDATNYKKEVSFLLLV